MQFSASNMPEEYRHELVANLNTGQAISNVFYKEAKKEYTLQELYFLCNKKAADQHAEFHGLWSCFHKVALSFDVPTHIRCEIRVHQGVPRLYYDEWVKQ